MKKPQVSVVMPVYNSDKYLPEAIESILDQTFSDFEFIIINDGSTDRSVKIIESYKDARIILINNEFNIGVTKSLNIGLEYAKYEYVARMDADDISLPDRLKKQVEFLKNNQDVSVLGTNCKAIDGNSKPIYKIMYPENHLRSSAGGEVPCA